MENELGMCEVFAVFISSKGGRAGARRRKSSKTAYGGDRAGGRGGVTIFFNYLFLFFHFPVLLPKLLSEQD